MNGGGAAPTAACKGYPLHGCSVSGGSSGLRLQQHPAGCDPSGQPQWAAPSQQHPQQRCKSSSKRRSSSPELLRCKRRLVLSGQPGGSGGGGAAAVARRNERERNRVKLVNLGFQTLRQHVPNGAAAKKMSKVETLRSAVEYIRALQSLLDEHDSVSAAFQESLLQPCQVPAVSVAPCSGGSSYSTASSDGREGSSAPGSPLSAYSSDESGYEGALSPQEQELLDFTSWFGGY